ncbi:hypothetical protein LUZ61_019517 [Rhynchospora tenuis]|uniref:AB hydrolase-1 domain-containing protein n=1 Tax=Rhynchospora tenuis TaxID=198213 RepID=A0AAD5ZBF4_9POAL|nr:hypothetical protein LUZ61_019517 [Rhynchospora tenuis]
MASIISILLSLLGTVVHSLINFLIPPPLTKICGSEGGPPITAKRIQLKDGRYLAYAEYGVNKADAKFNVIFCHGFTGTRLDTFNASKDLMEELGVYMVGFDRAGYGESDPDPNRSVQSTALDIEELADALGFGPKFYLIGHSIGGHAVWGAIKYIPDRIAAAVLTAPVINYRWPRFPKRLAREVYRKQHLGDQWSLRIAYYTPSILHWWSEQSWLPTSSAIKGTTHRPNKADAVITKSKLDDGSFEKRIYRATQQGKYESFYREMKVMFGKWEFDPMDLTEAPFPVHIFQGAEDGLVPVTLQRYLADQLSWINYNELPGTGHNFNAVPGLGNKVLKTLLGKPVN